jgi:hypothetical protein
VTATLHYRSNGGAWQTTALLNTGGAHWSASIPAQNCGTDVDYYLTALNTMGASGAYPSDAPNGMLDFLVGWRFPAYTTDFEQGANFWTHGIFGDTSSNLDEWQLAAPAGDAGDPYGTTSGNNAWGVDLGIGAFNGSYSSNIHVWLRSPPIDCSTMSDVRLRFRRWLTIERGSNDQALISVNGVVVWQNPSSVDFVDRTWVPFDLDISALAANNPNVVVEFAMRSDAALELGGWNLDDFSVFTLGACGHSVAHPTNFCAAKPTSNLTIPSAGSRGIPTVFTNNFSITLSDAMPTKQSICFWGTTPAALPFYGGYRCVQSPVNRSGAVMTDAVGFAQIAVPVTPAMAGTQRCYQWWFRDPPDLYTVGLSDGVSVDFGL